ncbi:MAG: site-specific integrase [Cypionkella sp.]|uniref:site-specific integrase n=1 Tax=Cypionkella sp. TaxID=2811411 RepID=UPI002AB81610|nr:site-specific integrase [Cypionkella sp.]MDZ4312094.1 site-specific integrase [Cypionkella sp.]
MKTIADVIEKVQADGLYAPASQKKVLGSLRRIRRMPQYGLPLDQISADLATFDVMWGHGPARMLPVGFKAKQEFTVWRSQVRGAIAKVVESATNTKAVVVRDAWYDLENELKKCGVNPKKLISVGVLAEAARKRSLSPALITKSWLQEQIDHPEAIGRYRALQAAAKLISKHRTEVSVEISTAFDGTSICKSRSCCKRLPLPAKLAAEFEEWRQQRIEGDRVGHRLKRRGACSTARADKMLDGVSYVYTAMVTAGLVNCPAECSVADLADPSLLEEIIEKELEHEFPWTSIMATTLFEYLSHWKLFVAGAGADSEPLRELISEYDAFENVKTMSSGRRDWCEEFLGNRTKQIAFLNLPDTIFRDARKAMSTFDSASQHHKAAAIAMGIAACAAAIWTSLPLRISTLLRLTYGGVEADVQLHGPRKGLVLTTPPTIVKNKYSHRYITLTSKPGGDPQEIVSWFVTTVRPKLMEAYLAPDLRRPNLLFGGISYSRLSSIWRETTLDNGVPMTPHQVRHALATIMANQKGADYAIISALLGDTEATVRKNYVFVDQAQKHEEGQNILANLQNNILKRGVK